MNVWNFSKIAKNTMSFSYLRSNFLNKSRRNSFATSNATSSKVFKNCSYKSSTSGFLKTAIKKLCFLSQQCNFDIPGELKRVFLSTFDVTFFGTFRYHSQKDFLRVVIIFDLRHLWNFYELESKDPSFSFKIQQVWNFWKLQSKNLFLHQRRISIFFKNRSQKISSVISNMTFLKLLWNTRVRIEVF